MGILTPTFSTKLRYTFDFFDTENKKALSAENILIGVKKLGLELTTSVVTDIHSKGDLNRDNVLCIDEWSGVCEMYPTMMDCLYYRAVDREAREKKVAEIEQKKADVTTLREAEVDAQKSIQDARRNTQELEEELNRQMDSLQTSLETEEVCKRSIEKAKEGTELARLDVTASQGEVNAAKDRERDTNSATMEAKRLVETATRRLTMQENRTTQAENLVRDLERQLDEARRNLALENAGVERLQTELDDSLKREKQASDLHSEAGMQLKAAMHRVGENEANVRRCQAEEKDAHAMLRDQQNKTKLLAAEKAHLTEKANHAAVQEQLKEQDQRCIAADIAEREEELRRLESALSEFDTRRQLTDEEEQPLIEQEVLLRRQREALERKEAQLNVQVTSFNDRTQRSSSPCNTPSAFASPSPARSM
eukprot:TRINITY_DN38049_c0_g1_i1.p1 TRINITY_DN38049_c0_g1~~TRINITY_DN38049_c0_g1_i1.p1  ORF type:complete len:439 (+),score=216.98 TRINITY_DN38049_c0_g1_i1:51-1319(+)